MSTGDSEGPAWNKFWLSLDHETESAVSGEGSHRPITPGRSLTSPDASARPPMLERGDSVLPNESASHQGDENAHSDDGEQAPAVVQDVPFPFKFKTPSGRVHRLQVAASSGLAELISSVAAKLGSEVDAVGGPASFEEGKIGVTGFALSYLDNEGDTVSITTDQDLLDAIMLAHRSHRDKVDLFVHDPNKPPMTATLDPQPGLSKLPTPPASEVRERRRHYSAEEEEEEEEEEEKRTTRKQRKQAVAQPKPEEQVIAGVPKDLLLPGAIVTLAVVIIGVFAISRASSR
ncbi:MAG: hypothetical protein LQ340_001129 [Diploschistes diacapsis]|nr:MAG: hypothetical protein LQ340_001129 [Diploschistes diacapsis]